MGVEISPLPCSKVLNSELQSQHLSSIDIEICTIKLMSILLVDVLHLVTVLGLTCNVPCQKAMFFTWSLFRFYFPTFILFVLGLQFIFSQAFYSGSHNRNQILQVFLERNNKDQQQF
uniref:Uncharacterized protein n=1 Tax=Cacopsylla melanoneura TaxID=428564 RepID=A0A8D8T9P0_9HEMI